MTWRRSGAAVPLVVGAGCLGRGGRGGAVLGATVAHAVARRLGTAVGAVGGPAEVRTVGLQPDQVVAAWVDRPLALVVCAVASGAPAGTLHRVVVPRADAESVLDGVVAGTAAAGVALGVADAVRLGWVLDRLPEQLVVLAVEVPEGDVDVSVALDPVVAAAVPTVVDAVLDELAIRACFALDDRAVGAVARAQEPPSELLDAPPPLGVVAPGPAPRSLAGMVRMVHPMAGSALVGRRVPGAR